MKKNIHTIFTSISFAAPKFGQLFLNVFNNKTNCSFLFITAASPFNNLHPTALLGFLYIKVFLRKSHISFLSRKSNVQKVQQVLSKKYNCVCVFGGNTFLLNNWLHTYHFKNFLLNQHNNFLYVGESAGTIVLSKSVHLAACVNTDLIPNNETNYNGLNLTPITPFPHYHKKYEHRLQKFEKDNNIVVTRITNLDYYQFNIFL